MHVLGFQQDVYTWLAAHDVHVHPALMEGFGIAVLEVMARGVPVITFNRTSLLEVTGEALVLVNPVSADEIEQALRRVLGDESLRESLRQDGLSRAKQFNRESAARQPLQVYREVCGVR